MLELILANLKVRPFRTLISVVGVALGVLLVVLFTGLVEGVTEDMAKRAANWKAEIVFTRAGAMELLASNLNVDSRYATALVDIEGVESAVPVGKYVSPTSEGSWGVQQIDGIDWGSFARQNDMSLIAGREAVGPDEIIVDERLVQNEKLHLGSTKKLFGEKEFKIVGIFSPPSGARIKMSLSAMQSLLDAPEKCTFILVKIKEGEEPQEVAKRINLKLPGNKVNLTRDTIADAQDRVPGLRPFMRTLVGLGAFVSVIFVLLSMYTTITERRREIGILKSLGSSKQFIILVIEGEALLIGILGIIVGFVTSFVASRLIMSVFELQFRFDRDWMAIAVLIAIGGSLTGALYPAWRASTIDPVEVMVNE